MKFDDLDARMRVYETAHDLCVLPGIHIVARLDGRGFTRLTKEVMKFEAPFDLRFRDMMAACVRHLMECGFRIVFGYSQSDEISLLFHRDDDSFHRKERKLLSVLSGEASAVLSLAMGRPAVMDCRVCQLPLQKDVVDYFRWRQEDAHRNALNAHCYWRLRGEGLNETKATAQVKGLSVADKNEMLFQRGVNFNDLPTWQKRGFGVLWRDVEKQGRNPITGEDVTAQRRTLHTEWDLPIREDYSALISSLCATP